MTTHDMYRDHEGQVWSGNPNDSLLKYAVDVSGDTALDIGGGEGADSAWLIEHGFRVTVIEPSETAVSAIRMHVPCANVINQTFEAAEIDSYDLVTAFYTPLLDDAATLDKLLSAVAPGGTLIVVHHDDVSHMARHHGREVSDFLLPPVLADRLAGRDDFRVIVNEESPRVVTGGRGADFTTDQVVKAQRVSTS